MKLQIRQLDENAKIPTRAYETDAGLDLYCLEDVTIYPTYQLDDRGNLEDNFPRIVKTGIAIQLTDGHYGHICEKSGLASRGIKVGGGIIDSSYTGEVKVIMYNLTASTFKFEKGQKVAQLIIQSCIQPEIEIVDNLEETDRSDSGFGSSGSW